MVSGKSNSSVKAGAGFPKRFVLALSVVVTMQIPVGQNVQARPVFVADDCSQRVLELLPKARIHHAGVQRPSIHAVVKPAGSRPGAGNRCWQYQVFGDGEHE